MRLALTFLIAAVGLAGCATPERLSRIGGPPPLTPIENPTASADYAPVTMPMPAPEQVVYQPNSLWAPGSRSFFKDQRAARIGDIMTVLISIDDQASFDNTTARSRQNGENADLTHLFGAETSLGQILPEAFDPTALVDLGSSSNTTGAGSVERAEKIELTVAAIVTQILPNGNLVIAGRQEIRVNDEVRELTISGVVRPEDITNGNTINHTQIAEARVSYGGRGTISDVQRPRYGQEVFDILFPF